MIQWLIRIFKYLKVFFRCIVYFIDLVDGDIVSFEFDIFIIDEIIQVQNRNIMISIFFLKKIIFC